jgi:hypothetical protein
MRKIYALAIFSTFILLGCENAVHVADLDGPDSPFDPDFAYGAMHNEAVDVILGYMGPADKTGASLLSAMEAAFVEMSPTKCADDQALIQEGFELFQFVNESGTFGGHIPPGLLTNAEIAAVMDYKEMREDVDLNDHARFHSELDAWCSRHEMTTALVVFADIAIHSYDYWSNFDWEAAGVSDEKRNVQSACADFNDTLFGVLGTMVAGPYGGIIIGGGASIMTNLAPGPDEGGGGGDGGGNGGGDGGGDGGGSGDGGGNGGGSGGGGDDNN